MKKLGRYEIVGELGRGAMGVVYKAADPTIGRLVALKVLSLENSPEPGVPGPQEIFMREARAAGRLAHPAIVTIHDAFEDADTKSSCIVMELVPGQTLEKRLLSGTQYSVEQTLEIVRQVADGLDYAHRQQVIHRDLKPANILLSEDGRAKLTDFGIAKILAREGALRTAGLLGTPAYMSPEQVTGKDIDARSDLFSLGIILYLMLTGQRPFVGDTAAVMFKIVYEDPVPPSKLNPQLTPAQDYLVLRLLAKDRDKRYQSAREFLDDLDDVRRERSPRWEAKVPASELPVGERTLLAQRVSMVLPPAPMASPTAEAAPRFPRKYVRWAVASGGAARIVRWGAASVGVALIILGGVFGVELWRSRQAKAPPASDLKSEISNLKSQTPPAASQTSPAAPQTSPAASQTSTAARQTSPAPVDSAALQSPTTTPAGKQETGTKKSMELAAKESGQARSRGRVASADRTAGGRTLRAAANPPDAKPVVVDRAAAPQPAPAAPGAQPSAAPGLISAVSSPSAATSNPPAAASRILIRCRYELKEGRLSVSNGAKEIFQADLKGKKKGGLHRLTGGYEGLLTDSLYVPAGTRDLTVRAASPQAGIDLRKPIAFAPPKGSSPVLEVIVKHDEIELRWRSPAPSNP